METYYCFPKNLSDNSPIAGMKKRRVNMTRLKPREWVNKHGKELREKFIGKTIIICEGRVMKIFDGPVNPLKINEYARKICKQEWCYTYLPKSEEEYLL